jgi:hypothetical protein
MKLNQHILDEKPKVQIRQQEVWIIMIYYLMNKHHDFKKYSQFLLKFKMHIFLQWNLSVLRND